MLLLCMSIFVRLKPSVQYVENKGVVKSDKVRDSLCQTLTRILVGVFVISITFEIDVISTTPSPEKKLLFKV